jgi:long-chain acyl-CoA synthetase
MTERIWLREYPEGVPADIEPSAYGSLVELIEESFDKYAERTAYRFMGKASATPRPTSKAARWPPTCRAWAWPRATAWR